MTALLDTPPSAMRDGGRRPRACLATRGSGAQHQRRPGSPEEDSIARPSSGSRVSVWRRLRKSL
ncbi:MAG: hypothetical protein R3F43_21705 [bacterium]